MAKPPKCKECGKEYTKFTSIQQWCSPECGYKLSLKKQAATEKKEKKEFNAETKRLKEKVKTKAQWAKEAQASFNKYIRLRDKTEPCISCGRHHDGQYHAGHYKSVGSSPELRFEELNNNKQCAPCNNHLSGNIVNYRPRLIDKIGIDRVEWLEGPHEPKHYSIDDLKEIKATYSAKARDLERA